MRLARSIYTTSSTQTDIPMEMSKHRASRRPCPRHSHMDIGAFDRSMLRGLHTNPEPSVPLEDVDNVSHECARRRSVCQSTTDQRGVQGVPVER